METSEAPLTWLAPQFFWLLPVVVIPLGIAYARRLTTAPRASSLSQLAVRLAVLVGLIAALAGATWHAPTDRLHVTYLVDTSASLDAAGRGAAVDLLRQAAAAAEDSGATIRFFRFDRQPQALPTDFEDRDLLAAPADAVEGEAATNLSEAISAARLATPPSYLSRLVVLSDGLPTDDPAAIGSAAEGSPIDTIALPSERSPQVQVASIEAPAEVAQGQPFFVDVTIASNTATRGTIDLFQEDIRVAEQTASLQPGTNRFRFEATVASRSRSRLVARIGQLEAAADDPRDNEAATVVLASGPPEVLFVREQTNVDPSLEQALTQQAWKVVACRPANLPDPAALRALPVVILDNVPADAWTPTQMQQLDRYVRNEGGGLVMIGGDSSFGPGGYYQTPLDDLLPVTSDYERDREKPGLALLLVLDRSGSMGGQKIALAKEAAIAAAELLGPTDAMGVVAFDNEVHWVSPLTSVRQRSRILRDIATMVAGGGTNLAPALREAATALEASELKRKHCIVLTDGISEPGDFNRLASDMAAAGITISTVAMGEEADQQRLQQIARLGGGRHYSCVDPSTVPQVFAQEAMQAGASAVREEPFLAQSIQATRVLDGVGLDRAPFLLGFVATRPKPAADLILATETGEPLLAWWRRGLGRTVAFTSDAESRWALEWLDWPDFGRFWSQVLRHAMRRQPPETLEITITPPPGNQIVVDAFDANGALLSGAAGDVTWNAADGAEANVVLDEIGPGRYAAALPKRQPQETSLVVTVRPRDGVPIQRPRTLSRPIPPEQRIRHDGEAFLKNLAATTGGRFAPTIAQTQRPIDGQVTRPIDLAPALLLIAAACWVVDVALRRLRRANERTNDP